MRRVTRARLRIKDTLDRRLGRPRSSFALEARAWYARGIA
jgi:hypothetical protein